MVAGGQAWQQAECAISFSFAVSFQERGGAGRYIHEIRVLVPRIEPPPDPYPAEPREDALHVGLRGRYACALHYPPCRLDQVQLPGRERVCQC